MKYYDRMLLIGKWILIISLVLIVLLSATVLKHHIDVRNKEEVIDYELGKLTVCDGKLPEE